jgi:putative methyltransferase
MTATARTDWLSWHGSYADPKSPLSERLRVIKRQIGVFLEARGGADVQVLSVCAGDGRDLLETLADCRQAHVRARLLELDPILVERARATAERLGLADIEVVCADAALTNFYAGAIPADLILLCGVFGNIADQDVLRTIDALPALCSSNGLVVWTRHRRDPDLTPLIRRWLAARDFEEKAFLSPGANKWSVGIHQFRGQTSPLRGDQRLFTFVR